MSDGRVAVADLRVSDTAIPLTERWMPPILWMSGAIAVWVFMRPAWNQCAVWDEFACSTWLGLFHRFVVSAFTFWLFAGTATVAVLTLDAIRTGVVELWRRASRSQT